MPLTEREINDRERRREAAREAVERTVTEDVRITREGAEVHGLAMTTIRETNDRLAAYMYRGAELEGGIERYRNVAKLQNERLQHETFRAFPHPITVYTQIPSLMVEEHPDNRVEMEPDGFTLLPGAINVVALHPLDLPLTLETEVIAITLPQNTPFIRLHDRTSNNLFAIPSGHGIRQAADKPLLVSESAMVNKGTIRHFDYVDRPATLAAYKRTIDSVIARDIGKADGYISTEEWDKIPPYDVQAYARTLHQELTANQDRLPAGRLHMYVTPKLEGYQFQLPPQPNGRPSEGLTTAVVTNPQGQPEYHIAWGSDIPYDSLPTRERSRSVGDFLNATTPNRQPLGLAHLLIQSTAASTVPKYPQTAAEDQIISQRIYNNFVNPVWSQNSRHPNARPFETIPNDALLTSNDFRRSDIEDGVVYGLRPNHLLIENRDAIMAQSPETFLKEFSALPDIAMERLQAHADMFTLYAPYTGPQGMQGLDMRLTPVLVPQGSNLIPIGTQDVTYRRLPDSDPRYRELASKVLPYYFMLRLQGRL